MHTAPISPKKGESETNWDWAWDRDQENPILVITKSYILGTMNFFYVDLGPSVEQELYNLEMWPWDSQDEWCAIRAVEGVDFRPSVQ